MCYEQLREVPGDQLRVAEGEVVITGDDAQVQSRHTLDRDLEVLERGGAIVDAVQDPNRNVAPEIIGHPVPMPPSAAPLAAKT